MYQKNLYGKLQLTVENFYLTLVGRGLAHSTRKGSINQIFRIFWFLTE